MGWIGNTWNNVTNKVSNWWNNLFDKDATEPGGNVDTSYLDGLFTSAGQEQDANRTFNSAQAALNRDFQSKEAQVQRDWYEYMSNSAYQRATADMKAAGINPSLAYQNGGASSAGTGIAAGSAASYNAAAGDSMSDILTAAADVINAVAGASGSKVNKAWKIFRMVGG